mgnify:CR=1 FL=1
MSRLIVVFLSVFFLLISTNSYSADVQKRSENAGNLKLTVTGFNSDMGELSISIWDSEEEFDKGEDDKPNPFMIDTALIKVKKSEKIFKNIPFKKYAIKLFHDENKNKDLDTNFMGMPDEGFGFSNNAMGQFGPPPFGEASFDFNKSDMSIQIELTNF